VLKYEEIVIGDLLQGIGHLQRRTVPGLGEVESLFVEVVRMLRILQAPRSERNLQDDWRIASSMPNFLSATLFASSCA
jgi:hypothetical protein